MIDRTEKNLTSVNLRRFGLATLFVALAYGLSLIPFADAMDGSANWLAQHVVLGPVAYIAFVVIATVLFLPGSAAMMVGGFLFGFAPGALFAAVAIPLGAHAAFAVGRWVARDWVRGKVDANTRVRAIESALQEQAFVIVVLTRLSLIIPFNLLNYVFGASAVRSSTHLLGTFVGMLPAVALYVYLGTLARDLGQIIAGEAAPQELTLWILAAGIIAIAIVTWIIHRAAARALERQLVVKGESESST